MPKHELEFERPNLLPKTIFDEIKRSPMLEIQPYRFRLQVAFSSYGALDDKTMKALEAAGEKIINDAQMKILKILQDAFKSAEAEFAKEKTDPKAFERAKKLAKDASGQIEEIAEGLAPAVRNDIDAKLKASVKEKVAKLENPKEKKDKTTSSCTCCFIGSGDGVRIKKGVFSGAGKEEDKSEDELAKMLDKVKSARTGFDFVLIDGKESGLAISKRTTGGDIKKAKEQAGGTGKRFFGEVSYESGKYFFTLDKDCSKGTRNNLAKDIRALVKEKCSKNIKVQVDNDDVADDD